SISDYSGQLGLRTRANDVTFQTNHGARIFLVMLSQFDKTAVHEVCSSDHIRFRCIGFACTGSVTTSFSSESRSAIQQRDDNHRKRFDPPSCKAAVRYSAEITALAAANMQAVLA